MTSQHRVKDFKWDGGGQKGTQQVKLRSFCLCQRTVTGGKSDQGQASAFCITLLNVHYMDTFIFLFTYLRVWVWALLQKKHLDTVDTTNFRHCLGLTSNSSM